MAFNKTDLGIIHRFLRDNPHLSSYDASNALDDMGITISYRTVMIHRRKFKIPFDAQLSLVQKLRKDFLAGIPFPTGREIAEKHGCCVSHANKSIREAMGIIPERKKNKVVALRESVAKEMPPVRVNTFQHMVTQLTVEKFVPRS